MNTMMQKIKKSSGLTLAETLITVLILLMVSSVVAVGVPSAARAYRNAVDAANAHVILSTAVNALRSELLTAWGVRVKDETTILYYSSRTGARTKLFYDDNTIKVLDYLSYNSDDTAQGDSKSYNLVTKTGNINGTTNDFTLSYQLKETQDPDIIEFETISVFRAGKTDVPLETVSLSIRILNPDLKVPELPVIS